MRELLTKLGLLGGGCVGGIALWLAGAVIFTISSGIMAWLGAVLVLAGVLLLFVNGPRFVVALFEDLGMFLRERAYAGDVRVYRFGIVEVRMIMKRGVPWFSANAVCHALGYEDMDAAIRHLSAIRHQSKDGRTGLYLSETAVEKLAERSRHLDANRFRVWFEREVMFQIRRARES